MLYWVLVAICITASLCMFAWCGKEGWKLYNQSSQEKSDKYRAERRAERKARQAFDDMIASHRDALWHAITK